MLLPPGDIAIIYEKFCVNLFTQCNDRQPNFHVFENKVLAYSLTHPHSLISHITHLWRNDERFLLSQIL